MGSSKTKTQGQSQSQGHRPQHLCVFIEEKVQQKHTLATRVD